MSLKVTPTWDTIHLQPFTVQIIEMLSKSKNIEV